MASRASLILLLTATLTASGLAVAYEGPERGQPWAGGPAAVAEGGEFLPAGEFRRHHRHPPLLPQGSLSLQLLPALSAARLCRASLAAGATGLLPLPAGL